MTITAEGLTVTLAGRRVLHGADLTAPAGAITVVIGPNGAGKSTLLKALAGLLEPESGSIRLRERPLKALSALERARAIAYLPQSREIAWSLSVRMTVALGRLPYRGRPEIGARAHAEAIEHAMVATDVSALAERPVTALSGGEQARVLLARALAQEARVLVADEPAAGLDPAHALEMFAVLGRLARAGRAVILAIHDLGLAARFADQVVLVHAGRIAVTGPPAKVLTPAHLEPAFGVRMLVTTAGEVPLVVPLGPTA